MLTVSAIKVFRRQLTSMDAFVFDTGSHVYAWVGKDASVAEKSKSLRYAQVPPNFLEFSRFKYFLGLHYAIQQASFYSAQQNP